MTKIISIEIRKGLISESVKFLLNPLKKGDQESDLAPFLED